MTGHQSLDVSFPDVPSAESIYRNVNDVDLHIVAAGSENDPLVVLLHGFPEFWYSWRHHIAPLVGAGYRVLVPDQRGYNGSQKPDGIQSYRMTELTRDVAELIDTEGYKSAHVVGHDWGGLIAWHLGLQFPELVDRLVTINAPHPSAFRQTVHSNLRQLRKSWYVFYFQLPCIPEWLSTRDDFGFWVAALRNGSQPDTFTETDIRRYRTAWTQEGAPTAMINWYRASMRYPGNPPRERTTVPTMVIWGENDQALVPELAARSIEYCDDGRLEQFSDATHWIHHEYPDRVSGLLLEHLEM